MVTIRNKEVNEGVLKAYYKKHLNRAIRTNVKIALISILMTSVLCVFGESDNSSIPKVYICSIIIILELIMLYFIIKRLLIIIEYFNKDNIEFIKESGSLTEKYINDIHLSGEKTVGLLLNGRLLYTPNRKGRFFKYKIENVDAYHFTNDRGIKETFLINILNN